MKNFDLKIENLSRCINSLATATQKELLSGDLSQTKKDQYKELINDLENFNYSFKKFIDKFRKGK